MKRFFLVLVFSAVFALACAAQPKSFGVRIGDALEATYQQDLFPGILEIDLGVAGHGQYSGLRLGASYDFRLVNVQWGEGNFVLFLGPGAGIGMYGKMQFAAGVFAQFGVEYDFVSIPLELAIDTRPGIWFGSQGIGMDLVTCIPMAAVRWRF